jgi:hypothetical protein
MEESRRSHEGRMKEGWRSVEERLLRWSGSGLDRQHLNAILHYLNRIFP